MNGHGGSLPSIEGAVLTPRSSHPTLCVPPALVKLTVSFSGTVWVLGVKVLLGRAVTSCAASARPGSRTSPTTAQHTERKRRGRTKGVQQHRGQIVAQARNWSIRPITPAIRFPAP